MTAQTMTGSVRVTRVGECAFGIVRDPRSRWTPPDANGKGSPLVRRLLILAMLASVLLTACASATPTPTSQPTAAPKPAASPAAAASPAGSPVVGASPSPSPSPAAAAAAGGGGTWATIRNALTSDLTLLSIGIILSILAVIAWSMSNRAEATPNEDQIVEMHHFVNDHFAKYVARGLAAEGVGPVAVSQDAAWRNVYLQHLRLHNELHPFVPPRHSWWGPIVSFACGGPVGLVVLYFTSFLPGRDTWWGPIVACCCAGALGIVPLWIIRRGVSPKIALRIFEGEIDEAVRRELDALRAAGQRANPAIAT